MSGNRESHTWVHTRTFLGANSHVLLRPPRPLPHEVERGHVLHTGDRHHLIASSTGINDRHQRPKWVQVGFLVTVLPQLEAQIDRPEFGGPRVV